MMSNAEDWKLQYSALESLLQCPVCYELCEGNLYQCHEGHHVCGSCRGRLPACPVCRSFFYGTRNYGLENIIEAIRRLRPTETPKIDTTTKGGSITKPHPKNKYSIPKQSKGLFPCMVDGCTESFHAARLLNHIRNKHSIIEGTCDERQHFSYNWSAALHKNFNLVIPIQVYKMGLFFIFLHVSHDGVLTAWIAMAASESIACQFDYTLTIRGTEMEGVFSDIVPSTRATKEFLCHKSRYLTMTQRQVGTSGLASDVECTLLLSPQPPVRLPMPVISLRKCQPLDSTGLSRIAKLSETRNGTI